MAISIGELTAAGIQLEADEAVAISQQLIELLRDPHAVHDVEPPYGPPSAETVFLKSDGTVVCRSCGTTPAVSEVGIFLHSLLRDGALRVPGGLRYAIARALLDVDVPPFDSLEDFSRDLARHEHGDRAGIVRRLLARAGCQPSALVVHAAAAADRRTWHAPATDLRRALREADARLYEYQRRRNHEVLQVKAPPRGRTMTATVACLAAGIALIGTGELMYHRTGPIVVPTPAPIAAQSSAPDIAAQSSVPDQPAPAAPQREATAVGDAPSMSASASSPEVRRIAVKRTKRPSTTASRQSASRPASRGVLDRLRLGWLRNAFSPRSSSARSSL